MAKKKTTDELGKGTRVRVKGGTMLPEFPDVACGGWTGVIEDATGKKPNIKYVIKWDDATLSALPAAYVQACEAKQLYYPMACLDGSVLDPASS
jgi:hypothetical protein